MRTIITAALILVGIILMAIATFAGEPIGSNAKIVALGFSPSHQCTEIVVKLIDSAKKEIDGEAYNFTSAPVAAALDAAKARGVLVQLILDQKANLTNKHSERVDVEKHQVAVWIDGKHPISHSKVFVVDQRFVETGSFNYSSNAEKNHENCIVLDDRDLAAAYIADWKAHQAHSARNK